MVDFERTMSVATKRSPGSSVPAVDFDQWKLPLAGAAVIFGLFIALFWSFLRSQVIRAVTEQADWGHTLVVPLIAGYFVYLNRANLLSKPFKTTWMGLAPMVLGVGIYMVSIMGPPTLNHFNIQGLGVWLTMFGLVLLFFGWRAMRWLWFPLVYIFFFGQNISDQLLQRITFKMQDMTAHGSQILLSFFLDDVSRSGNTISILHQGVVKPLNIAQACSGMRMLMAFLALGVAMAYTGFKPLKLLNRWEAAAGSLFARAQACTGLGRVVAAPLWFCLGGMVSATVLAVRNWQRIVLVALAVPTSIFVNILRVCTLGFLSLMNSDFAAGDFHSFVGLVWLVPAFLIFLGLMWIIRQVMVDEPAREARA